MAIILPTHEPFLQTKAQVLVLPVSADGNILHPVLMRCKSLFADNYQIYYKSAMQGGVKAGSSNDKSSAKTAYRAWRADGSHRIYC